MINAQAICCQFRSATYDQKSKQICNSKLKYVLVILHYKRHVIENVCRLIFIVFYLAAGTTDTPCEVTFNPSPSEKDISFILNEVKNYLSEDVTVRRGDVLSAWAGIRPLVKDPNKEDTQSLVRNHVIHVSPSGLVTIGKIFPDIEQCRLVRLV